MNDAFEVNGQAVWAFVDGMGAFTMVASQYLLSEGIGVPRPDGMVQIDATGWYPRHDWLRAVERIGREIGEVALFEIGRAIPRNARFPAFVLDMPSAIQSIDVAYHMNHRCNGVEMYDTRTGEMSEGIGHYGYQRAGSNMVVSRCDGPYPCAFDRGVVSAMANRFNPSAIVEHGQGPCRAHGGAECNYVVTWP